MSRHYAFEGQFLETRCTDPLATVSADYHAHVQMIMSLRQSCIDVRGTAAELQLHTGCRVLLASLATSSPIRDKA
jgi:hypothetical protein